MNLDFVTTKDLEEELDFRRTEPKAYLCYNSVAVGNLPLYHQGGRLMVESLDGKKYVLLQDGQKTIVRLIPHIDYEGIEDALISLGVEKSLTELAIEKHKTKQDPRVWIDLCKRFGF